MRPTSICLFLVLATTTAQGQVCEPAWSDDVAPNGSNGVVLALAEGAVGGADRLYAGGAFLTMNGVSASRVAQWDGATWSPLGLGVDGNAIAMALYDEGAGDRLFVGGAFSKANNTPMSRIARWDGSTWSGVSTGITGSGSAVRSLLVHDDGAGESLFVAGFFTTAGGVAATNIARWDDSQFHALGPGLNGIVHAMAAHDDGTGLALYVVGEFTHTGDGATALSHIARWDGSTWTSVGGGLDGAGRSIVSGVVGGADALFVGGLFANAGGGAAVNVARWDGAAWSPLAGGVNATVSALKVIDGSLYLAGEFQFVNGVNMRGVTIWDGSVFTPMGSGLNAGGPHGYALVRSAVAGDALVLGGSFSSAGGVLNSNIAQWNLCTMSGPDLNGDGVVNGEDLAKLLAAWGAGGPADFDASGVVDGSDLAALLAAWSN
jgi:hypothetical protein